MKKKVTHSQFQMWRTLFALAHADDVITGEEVRFMAEVLEDEPFTEAQRKILEKDVKNAQDVVKMFKGISDVKDQARFFKFARELVWADGEYGKEEQEIMLKLMKEHVGQHKVDKLIGKVELQFEDEPSDLSMMPPEPQRSWKAMKLVSSFKKNFSSSASGEDD